MRGCWTKLQDGERLFLDFVQGLCPAVHDVDGPGAVFSNLFDSSELHRLAWFGIGHEPAPQISAAHAGANSGRFRADRCTRRSTKNPGSRKRCGGCALNSTKRCHCRCLFTSESSWTNCFRKFGTLAISRPRSSIALNTEGFCHEQSTQLPCKLVEGLPRLRLH